MIRPHTRQRWWPLGTLVVCSLAGAQPRSRADERFQQGRQLMAAGKYAEACAAFEDSEQLDPAVTTLLNLGACREKAAELASAVTVFRAAEQAARREGTSQSKELAQIARGHVARLEPQLSTLTIVVPREPRIEGLVVERDGAQIDPKQWDLPIAIDGGRYTIVASAPGHADWSTTILIKPEHDAHTIHVPELGAAAPAPAPAPDRQEGHTHAPARPGDSRHSMVWPIAFGAGALAAAGAAWWFSRRGDDLYARSKVEPNLDRQDDLWRRANHQRYAAEGLAGAGVVFVGVAVWLLVRGDGSSRDGVALQPSLLGDGAAVQVVGTY